MKNNIDYNMCCGCGACVLKCPKRCIRLNQDADGFWKAECNINECVGCGICHDVCPISSKPKSTSPIKAYAAAVKKRDIYKMGSSGGIFPEIAVNILENGGYVWGCGYDDKTVPLHKEVHRLDDLDDLCRSKYVQSYTGGIYEKIKERIETEKSVLFCGTPCQVAGLKNYLGKDYDNLFLIDIVCHGVPSPKFFRENLDYISDKHNKKISRYEFRLKSPKNKCYNYSYIFEDGETESGPYYKDAYFNAFYDMVDLNEVCYKCPFACGERMGDITIGDFEWGKKYHDSLKGFNEISSIIINTEKGNTMFERISSDLQFEETKTEYIVEKNLNLVRPTVRPKSRDGFYAGIKAAGYKKWANAYYHSLDYYKKTPILKPLVKLKIMLNRILHK